jgi:hypothetical protein
MKSLGNCSETTVYWFHDLVFRGILLTLWSINHEIYRSFIEYFEDTDDIRQFEATLLKNELEKVRNRSRK